MDDQELLKERFKSAVSSAVTAISENFDLEIKFGNSVSSKENALSLPEIVNLKKLQDFTNLRAFADSEALKIKYTDEKIYTKNQPEGTIAKNLYAIAEKIRYEKIGSESFLGIKKNLFSEYKNDKKSQGSTKNQLEESFDKYLKSYFFDIKETKKFSLKMNLREQ